jgi:hypothetical protein
MRELVKGNTVEAHGEPLKGGKYNDLLTYQYIKSKNMGH